MNYTRRALDYKQFIIDPVLKRLNMHSLSAVNLLLGTAAQESKLGYYIKQIDGPALGIYQIEPNTYFDIIENFLAPRKGLYYSVFHEVREDNYYDVKNPHALIYDLWFATAICRIHYYRVAEPLPESDDVFALGKYWKRYFNTDLGKGTINEFIHNYNKLIKGD